MPAFVGQLTNDSSYDDVAHAIIAEAKRRGHTRDEAIGEVADGIQESQLDPQAHNPAGPWDGIYQQDGGYPGRFDANTQITGFMDRLDAKRTSPGHGDIWLNIFWLQQRPSEPSAQQAYDNGRQGYLTEIKSRTAEATRLVNKYWDDAPQGEPTVPNAPATPQNRPDFNEYPIWLTGNSQDRQGTDVDLWLLHTEQGHFNDDNAAVDLRNFLESSKGSGNPVSYHYTGRTARDGGTTVIDCVDTDLASWSVGNSNNRSINYCFAGSDIGWTREEWLEQMGAISAAAYLFVQDAAKYPKLKVAVIADPYSDPPGAADHNYCSVYLQDGNNHSDVGPNFPWDVFKAEVAKYSVGAAPEPDSPPQPSSAPTGTPDYAKLAYEQLGGLIDPATGLATGWPQLGKNGQGQNLTVVDALAGLIVRVHNLEAALAAQTPLPAPKPAGGKPAAKKAPAKKAPAKKTATGKAPKK